MMKMGYVMVQVPVPVLLFEVPITQVGAVGLQPTAAGSHDVEAPVGLKIDQVEAAKMKMDQVEAAKRTHFRSDETDSQSTVEDRKPRSVVCHNAKGKCRRGKGEKTAERTSCLKTAEHFAASCTPSCEAQVQQVILRELRAENVPEASPHPPGPVMRGSEQHPHNCQPCKFYSKKGRGCVDGDNCSHCHLCKWVDQRVRPQRKRLVLEKERRLTLASLASTSCVSSCQSDRDLDSDSEATESVPSSSTSISAWSRLEMCSSREVEDHGLPLRSLPPKPRWGDEDDLTDTEDVDHVLRLWRCEQSSPKQ
mmetsp:Transcript_4959/g.7988  ORF Transcript_4959/g.7988 Transcript_4959/m.7988 type:complete len:308 (-) Transcript_4959:59-982(-)